MICKYCGLNYGSLGIQAVINHFAGKPGLKCEKNGTHEFVEDETLYRQMAGETIELKGEENGSKRVGNAGHFYSR
jgi:hypothetical protein